MKGTGDNCIPPPIKTDYSFYIHPQSFPGHARLANLFSQGARARTEVPKTRIFLDFLH